MFLLLSDKKGILTMQVDWNKDLEKWNRLYDSNDKDTITHFRELLIDAIPAADDLSIDSCIDYAIDYPNHAAFGKLLREEIIIY